MGVYIKGLEMPKSCAECPVNMNICKRGYKYLLAHMELYNQRADDCPITTVPPHGRLIDADALKAKAIERSEKCGEMVNVLDKVITVYDILTAPTIIPAEPCNNLSKPCKEGEP